MYYINIRKKWYIGAYLSGTFSSCQHGANSQFFGFFSTFGLMHQNVVTLGGGGGVCFSKSVRKGRFRNVWVGGGGRWSQFCAQSCKREDTQGTGNAPGITHYSESNSLSSPLCTRAGTSGDLHVSHFAPNRRRCRLPEVHVVKPWWGASFYPKIVLLKQRPQKRIESGVPRGHMQVARGHM